MDFKEYQAGCLETVKPNVWRLGWLYPLFGIGGESGEIFEKFKKIIRDSVKIDPDMTIRELLEAVTSVTQKDKAAISKEIGDILWYLSFLCTQLGLNLGEVARENLAKLLDRKERGALGGSGDDR